jgi:hypothetical protein
MWARGESLAQRYPGIRMRRLFNSVKAARLAAMVEEARVSDGRVRTRNLPAAFARRRPAPNLEQVE